MVQYTPCLASGVAVNETGIAVLRLLFHGCSTVLMITTI